MNSDFEILWRKWTEHSFDSSLWRRMTDLRVKADLQRQVKSSLVNFRTVTDIRNANIFGIFRPSSRDNIDPKEKN